MVERWWSGRDHGEKIMNGRFVAVAMGAAALALGLLVVLGDGTSDGAVEGPVSSGSASTSGGMESACDEGATPIVSHRFVGDPEIAADSEPVAAPRGRLRGQVIARTSEGLELPGLDGDLVLRFFAGEWGEETSVKVDAGRWACAVDDYAYVEVVRCVLGGLPIYFPDEQHHQDRPADGFLKLRGVRGQALGLRVVDARTGADLRDVSVFRNCRWAAWTTCHPGDLATAVAMVTNGVSPLTIDPPEVLEDPQVKCWVIAPGYAWGKLGLDHASGGKRVVELEDGGTVEVRIVGERPAGASLFLRSLEPGFTGPLLEVAASDDGSYTVDGVRVGTYEVTLEVREWFVQYPHGLGRARAVVRKGETVIVRLDTTDAPAPPPRVTVQGTLTLPAGWPRPGVALYLVATGATKAWVRKPYKLDLSAMIGSGERFVWSMEAVVVGDYTAVVSPMGASVSVSVSESEECSVDVVVPATADVVVTVWDGLTGALIAPSKVKVKTEIPGAADSPWVQPDEHGALPLQFAVGPLVLLAASEGYHWGRAAPVLQAGRNAVDIVLFPACGLTFVLKDGAATVPFEREWVRLEDLGGRGYVRGSSTTGVSVSESGTYRVHWTIPGFKPVPSTDVFVPPRTWVPMVVQLKR